MTHPTETGETRAAAKPTSSTPDRVQSLDVIACDGCGRFFATDDGPGMMAVLTGPCPDCGGRFQLAES